MVCALQNFFPQIVTTWAHSSLKKEKSFGSLAPPLVFVARVRKFGKKTTKD
jgi:hypothetical protein